VGVLRVATQVMLSIIRTNIARYIEVDTS